MISLVINESKDLAKECRLAIFLKQNTDDNKAFLLNKNEKISDPKSYFKANVYYCSLNTLIFQAEQRFQSFGDLIELKILEKLKWSIAMDDLINKLPSKKVRKIFDLNYLAN